MTTVLAPIDSPHPSVPVSFRQSATDADNHGIATVAALYAQDQVELSQHVQAVVGVALRRLPGGLPEQPHR